MSTVKLIGRNMRQNIMRTCSDLTRAGFDRNSRVVNYVDTCSSIVPTSSLGLRCYGAKNSRPDKTGKGKFMNMRIVAAKSV